MFSSLAVKNWKCYEYERIKKFIYKRGRTQAGLLPILIAKNTDFTGGNKKMIERYTHPEMGHIWTLENEFRTMLQVEILACEAMNKLASFLMTHCRIFRLKLISASNASKKSKLSPTMTSLLFWQMWPNMWATLPNTSIKAWPPAMSRTPLWAWWWNSLADLFTESSGKIPCCAETPCRWTQAYDYDRSYSWHPCRTDDLRAEVCAVDGWDRAQYRTVEAGAWFYCGR